MKNQQPATSKTSKTSKTSNYHKNLKMNENAPASWCLLPWSRISIRPDGKYRLCCNSDPNLNTKNSILKDKQGQPLHISKANWEDVFNSDLMKSARKNMLQGKWPKECLNCQMQYESGLSSLNISSRFHLASLVESDIYPGYKKAKLLTQSDGSISLSDFPTSDLDLRFGNLCNLKCVMCSPKASNQWYEDYRILWKKDYIDKEETIKLKPDINGKWKPEKDLFEWSEDPHLLSQIESYVKNFRKMYFTGGEPLLINAHYKFLEMCIEKGVAKRISLDYHSNITHIPEKTWKLWQYFKSVKIGISLDGYGKINEFIRFPSKWDIIESNLMKLDVAQENIKLRIETSVSVLNIYHLPEFLEYILSKNYKKISSSNPLSVINHHPVHMPGHLDINILENEFKEKIEDHFNKFKKKFSKFDWQSTYGLSHRYSWTQKIKGAYRVLDDYLKYMRKKHYAEEKLIIDRRTFIYYMDKLDELRKTNWSQTCPELYESTLTWRQYKI